jgi:hypothetical protein
VEAPETPPPIDDASRPGDSLRWSAVGIGIAIDLVATLTASMLVGALATTIATSRSRSPDAAQQYIEQLQASPDFMLLFTLVGLLCVSLGGFVAARRAGFAEVRHAGLVGVGSLLISLATENLQSAETAGQVAGLEWLSVFGYVLVIPFGLLGGILAERTRPEEPGEPQ